MEVVTIPEFSYQNISFHLFIRLFTILQNLHSIDKFSLVSLCTKYVQWHILYLRIFDTLIKIGGVFTDKKTLIYKWMPVPNQKDWLSLDYFFYWKLRQYLKLFHSLLRTIITKYSWVSITQILYYCIFASVCVLLPISIFHRDFTCLTFSSQSIFVTGEWQLILLN